MTTDELVEALAEGARAVAPAPIGRLAWPAIAGALVALVFLLNWLGLRPLDDAARSSSFWMKSAYTGALTLAGAMMAWRLARPGARAGAAPLIGAVAFGLIASLAAAQLALAGRDEAAAMWLGQSWAQCPFRILALAGPIFAGAVLGLRRLAPTRLAMAGAAAGLLAGATAATIYGLYCQETAAAFVATWYTLGIAACVAVGALLGPRVLRW